MRRVLRRQKRMASKKEEEPILQWQDGIGNIPVFQDDGAPEWNPTIRCRTQHLGGNLFLFLMIL